MRTSADRSRTAFTFTELLVVIAIIGILAVLLLPTFTRTKAKAQQAVCMLNLRQLGTGLQGFVAVNHVYPTLWGGTNSDNAYGWMYQLEHGGFDISKPPNGYWEKGVGACPSVRWLVSPRVF